MEITFIAEEDIQKGQKVVLDFDTGELKIVSDTVFAELQPKEEPNIIEDQDELH